MARYKVKPGGLVVQRRSLCCKIDGGGERLLQRGEVVPAATVIDIEDEGRAADHRAMLEPIAAPKEKRKKGDESDE